MAITEVYPADAAFDALGQAGAAGQGDTGMPLTVIGAAPHYTNKLRHQNWIDRFLYRLNSCRITQDTDDADNQFSMFAGADMPIGSTLTDIAEAKAQTLATDNGTNYMYLDSAGALQCEAAFPTDESFYFPLASIVAAAGEYDLLTDVADLRPLWSGGAVAGLVAHKIPLVGNCGDFFITDGGWGDGSLTVKGADVVNATLPNAMEFIYELPPGYVADGAVTVRFRAKYAGTGTAGTCTIDIECYELDADGAAGADINATAAINLTNAFADREFTITDTGLAPGDRIRVLMRTSIQETGAANPLYAQLGSMEVECLEL